MFHYNLDSLTSIFSPYLNPNDVLSVTIVSSNIIQLNFYIKQSYIIQYEELSWNFNQREIRKIIKRLNETIITLPNEKTKGNYLSIFNVKQQYRLFLYLAYNKKFTPNKIYTIPSLSKLLIKLIHITFDPFVVYFEGEKKHLFPQLSPHTIREEMFYDREKSEKKEENYIQKEEIEDKAFPMKIIGNVEKKGSVLGFFNYRYLELDTINGLIKRFLKTEDYPNQPK